MKYDASQSHRQLSAEIPSAESVAMLHDMARQIGNFDKEWIELIRLALVRQLLSPKVVIRKGEMPHSDQPRDRTSRLNASLRWGQNWSC